MANQSWRFAIQDRGFETLYEPLSILGLSSGVSSGAIHYCGRMGFPISICGDLPLPEVAVQAGDGAQLQARLIAALDGLGLAAERRTSTSIVFEAGWQAPWPFKGCSGTLETERDEDGARRLSYHVSLQAWAMIMTVVVPFVAYLLMWHEVGIAPIWQFAILLVALPLGWFGAMALVHRIVGTRLRNRLDQILNSVSG